MIYYNYFNDLLLHYYRFNYFIYYFNDSMFYYNYFNEILVPMSNFQC